MYRLYWRCVWANKVILTAYCLFCLAGAMEIVRQMFLGPVFVNGLAYPGLAYLTLMIEFLCCVFSFTVCIATNCGNDTLEQYHRTMSIASQGHGASISETASYCFRIGHELALWDYAKR